MNESSHRGILVAGLERAGVAWLLAEREALLRGNDDEDVHIVPLLGWRLRSIGLTHTYRPGKRGELGTPSALELGSRYVRQAVECRERDRPRAAYLLGRTCHLLVDTSVPARARGVWHFFGDPFEDKVEELAADLPTFGCGALPGAPSLEALFESLALLAAGHEADTTRTPWGALRWAMGRGTRVSAADAVAQARVLVPLAVAHVAALFLGFEAWSRSAREAE